MKAPRTESNATADVIALIDIEGTHLDVNQAHMMEIAIIITTYKFEYLDSYRASIRLPKDASLSNWAQETHSRRQPGWDYSLLYECHSKDLSLPLETVDMCAAQLLDRHRNGGLVVVGGSSLTYDRRMIDKHLPRLNSRLHYRNIDVSGILEITKHNCSNVRRMQPSPSVSHRAMDDILSSQRLLLYYRDAIFKPAEDHWNQSRFKSTDGGNTFSYVGAKQREQFYRQRKRIKLLQSQAIVTPALAL